MFKNRYYKHRCSFWLNTEITRNLSTIMGGVEKNNKKPKIKWDILKKKKPNHATSEAGCADCFKKD